MKLLKTHYRLISEIVFFALVFFYSIKPLRDFDLWFHVKSGEIIAQLGIIHYDVFSNSAHGREWIPYEWLFQLGVYRFQQLFGFEAIKYLIAFVFIAQLFIIYRLLRKVFDLNYIYSLITCLFFVSFVYDFVVARPHIVAYTFLVINLSLIYLYYFKNKNWLWLTLPITLIWANMHGSIFLDIALFGGYGTISAIQFLITKEKLWRKKTIVLSLYTLLSAVLTILPPLGFLQYKLLWIFFQQRNFISIFIDEWTPLNLNPVGFTIYTASVVLVLGLAVLQIKKRGVQAMLWILPLLPLIFFAYSASRNVYLGGISLSIIFGWSLTVLEFKNYKKSLKITLILLLAGFSSFNIWLISAKNTQYELYYPIKATQFIKTNDLKGNMFNEYAYGGYLLYELYPKQKVFFDGRTDVYLCCEIRDTFNVTEHKNLPDTQFRDYLYKTLWNKHDISFVLLRTERNTVMRKITRLLNTDSDWSLVFWDDWSQLFIRKDGKNDQIIKQFGVKYATPYLQDPYPIGKENEALAEYLKMDQIAKSAHTSNAIGFIELRKGQFDLAKKRFEEALRLDPSFESPLMNLGELSAKDGDYYHAIELYKQAQKLALDRGLIYIRLGQLYIQGYGDTAKAKEIWTLGIKQTADKDAKTQLQKLLTTI